MEKVKYFLLNLWIKVKHSPRRIVESLKNKIVSREATGTSKRDFNRKSVVTFLSIVGVIFIVIMLVSPSKEDRKFREVEANKVLQKASNSNAANQASTKNSKSGVWSYSGSSKSFGGGQQPNLNSSMLVQAKSGGNAGLQFSQGSKLRVRLSDKFSASDSSVPVIATVTEDVTTDYGMTIFSGSQVYGEATYSKSSERAEITFKQLVMTSGEIKPIQAKAVGFDGKQGIEGNVESNVMQTSFGQVVTSFVGGLAAGSVERDLLGNSKGGLTNGLLNAVAETARSKAEKYGESLKEEKVWINVSEGVEFDVVLDQPLKMVEQNGGER